MPASAAVLAVAVDGTIRATAGSAGALLGIGSGDLVGRHAAEVVNEPDCSRFLDQLAVPDRPQRYLIGGRWLEAEVLDRRDDPDIGELVVRWRDVSELAAVAEALTASEDRYRSLSRPCPRSSSGPTTRPASPS